jgi:hypothetical protein
VVSTGVKRTVTSRRAGATLKPYYNLREVSALMGETYACIKSRARRGTLQTVKLSGRIVVPLEILQQSPIWGSIVAVQAYNDTD